MGVHDQFSVIVKEAHDEEDDHNKTGKAEGGQATGCRLSFRFRGQSNAGWAKLPLPEYHPLARCLHRELRRR